MLIGVDLDGTLTDPRVQHMIKAFVRNGHTVYVVTARDKEGCSQPHFKDIMYKAGIPEIHLIYTSGESKWPIIDSMGFDLFIDNNKKEAIDIACHTKCISLQFIDEI